MNDITTKQIIGICGLIGNGKDAVATHLESKGYQRLSFAMALKDVCSTVFGWDREMLEGLTPEARQWREQVDLWWEERLGIDGFTPRYAMQYLGTDLFREHFHKDIWVSVVGKRILDALDKDPNAKIVISDCRFFNEIEIIKNMGGMTVDIWRHDPPEWWDSAVLTNLTTVDNEWILYDDGEHMETKYPTVHPSEWSWAGWDFDHTIHNNGTLKDLYKKVNKLVS